MAGEQTTTRTTINSNIKQERKTQHFGLAIIHNHDYLRQQTTTNRRDKGNTRLGQGYSQHQKTTKKDKKGQKMAKRSVLSKQNQKDFKDTDME